MGGRECIPQRVQAARDVQQLRFTNYQTTDIICNAEMREGEIRQFCRLQPCPELVEGMKVRA